MPLQRLFFGLTVIWLGAERRPSRRGAGPTGDGKGPSFGG